MRKSNIDVWPDKKENFKVKNLQQISGYERRQHLKNTRNPDILRARAGTHLELGLNSKISLKKLEICDQSFCKMEDMVQFKIQVGIYRPEKVESNWNQTRDIQCGKFDEK